MSAPEGEPSVEDWSELPPAVEASAGAPPLDGDPAKGSADSPAPSPAPTPSAIDAEPARPGAGFGQKAPEPGVVIAGRYRVLGHLGAGGFGQVYEAEHVELQRKVALKVLHQHLTSDTALFSRFQQEARSAANIGHPNIVQVFDLGRDEHGAFIAMELLDGEELEDRIERDHPLPEPFVARVGADIAEAIAAAHERGVIHRDLKPQNVFLARQGAREDVVKVIDFGIAKLVDHDLGKENLTTTGQVVGTPRFMAPEQLRGGAAVDKRVDVYAIGALLYRALTGGFPFDGTTYADLILRIITDPPPPLSARRPGVSEAMAAIVDRCLAKSPEDRFGSAGELADALRLLAEDAPIPRLSDPSSSAPGAKSVTPTDQTAHPVLASLSGSRAASAPPAAGQSAADGPAPSDSGVSASAASASPEIPGASRLRLVLGLGGAGIALLALLVGGGLYVTDGDEPGASLSASAPPSSFRVAVTTVPDDAELQLDGEPVGRGSLERDLPRDGRSHRLVVRAEGYAPATLVFRDAAPLERVVLEPLERGAEQNGVGADREAAAEPLPGLSASVEAASAEPEARAEDDLQSEGAEEPSTAAQRHSARRRSPRLVPEPQVRPLVPAAATPPPSPAPPRSRVRRGVNGAPIVVD